MSKSGISDKHIRLCHTLKRTAVIASLLLLASTGLKAQKNLQPAYVVLDNNDTLKGLIDHREWSRNPSQILFKRPEETSAKAYTVNEIKYFEITGHQSYVRQRCRISLDTDNFANISTMGRDTSAKTDVVFLQVLLAGKNVTLFSFRDEI